MLTGIPGLVGTELVVGGGAKVPEEAPGLLTVFVYHKVVDEWVFG